MDWLSRALDWLLVRRVLHWHLRKPGELGSRLRLVNPGRDDEVAVWRMVDGWLARGWVIVSAPPRVAVWRQPPDRTPGPPAPHVVASALGAAMEELYTGNFDVGMGRLTAVREWFLPRTAGPEATPVAGVRPPTERG